MSTTLKFLLIPVISIYTLWIYYFFIYAPNYRKNLAQVSNEIIVVLWQDKEIYGISHNVIFLTEKRQKCSSDSSSTTCIKKNQQYKWIISRIPSGISFYNCLWKFIIRNEQNNIHFILKESLKEAEKTWVQIIDNGENWLRYNIKQDRFNDAGPCYPWDDLEDYKKRYSSISRYLPHNP